MTARKLSDCPEELSDAELDAMDEGPTGNLDSDDIRRLIAALRRARARQGETGALNALRDAAHANSREKGFWDGQSDGIHLVPALVIKTIPEKLMLIVTEIAEAMECYREGGDLGLSYEGWSNVPPGADEEGMVYCDACKSLACQRAPKCNACGETAKPKKPVGFASELADVYLRIGDLAGALGIDLDEAVRAKAAYNKTRPHKHGKVC